MTCPHCRKALSGTPNFCTYCGQETRGMADPAARPAPRLSPASSLPRAGFSTPKPTGESRENLTFRTVNYGARRRA